MTELNASYSTTAQPKSNTTLIIVALCMGLLSVLILTLYVSRVKNETRSQMVTVYQLNKPVEAGHTFRKSRDAKEVRKPLDFVEALPSIVTADTISNWDNQATRQAATENSFVTTELFEQSEAGVGEKITEGHRGAPLAINARTSPGLLRPNMRVDILGTFTPPGQLPKTMLVMENVRVVAVGTQTDPNASTRSSFGAITIEVTKDQAIQLTQVARHIGKDGFDILIRPPGEPQTMIGVNPDVLKLINPR